MESDLAVLSPRVILRKMAKLEALSKPTANEKTCPELGQDVQQKIATLEHM